MKIVFYLFAICIVFTSCQKELDYNTSTGTGTTGGTTGNGTTTTADCKACSYFPMCDGIRYSMYDTLFGGAPTVIVDTFKFIKDTMITGKNFQKIYFSGSKSTGYYNCTNGATTANTYNAALVLGGSISALSVVLIRATVAVNGTWKDTILNQIGQQVIYTYTMKAKAISKTINGISFSDVILIGSESAIEVPGIGAFTTANTDYYYAKGVGLVESVSFDYTSNMQIDHRTIKSYFIP